MIQADIPPLPGATGVTYLKVYDTLAPDGLYGGSAHVHFACTEAYIVVAGQGAVQTLGPTGFQETSLEPGKLVWFTPGMIHRLVNLDGQLEILVVMQNAGVPEAGDVVLVFPPAVLADRDASLIAASLAEGTRVYATGLEATHRRRDLAIDGFTMLRTAFEQQGITALAQFYRQAVSLIQPQLDRWHEIWQQGPHQEAAKTGHYLDQLAAGQIDHLLEASVQNHPAPPDEPKLGMCGTLGVYLPEGAVRQP
jgi:mannose-6-phosphate isomerase-like protein (cupin superfamily)